MKILNLFYKYFFYIFMFWMIVLSKTAVANEVLEDRVKKLAIELRCMTCQNQSIYDSESEFSKDIIKVIEKKFTEGLNEEEIKSFLINRYGEYILFKPLFNIKNLVLWLFPFVLLVISFVFFLIKIKKK